MAVFLPLHERIHLSYNENEITDLMYDQLDDAVQKYDDKTIETFVLMYTIALYCTTFFYIMYIIIS